MRRKKNNFSRNAMKIIGSLASAIMITVCIIQLSDLNLTSNIGNRNLFLIFSWILLLLGGISMVHFYTRASLSKEHRKNRLILANIALAGFLLNLAGYVLLVAFLKNDPLILFNIAIAFEVRIALFIIILGSIFLLLAFLYSFVYRYNIRWSILGTVLGIWAVMLVGLGIFAYREYRYYNSTDLMDYCQITYYGLNKQGTGVFACFPESTQNKDMYQILKSASATIQDNGKLENGTSTQVRIEYDQSYATKHSISLKNTEFQSPVSGLTEAALKYEDLSEEVQKEANKSAQELVKEQIQGKEETLLSKFYFVSSSNQASLRYLYKAGNDELASYYLVCETISAKDKVVSKIIRYYSAQNNDGQVVAELLETYKNAQCFEALK